MARIISSKTTIRWGNDVSAAPIGSLPIAEVVTRIEDLNSQIGDFWSKSDGWAPAEAAGLLGKSRLDWQVSLSQTLHMWIDRPTLSPAELILAWANLGSLIEGSVKLLLSVYYDTYRSDLDNLKKANAYDHKKAKAHSPDGLTLEPLRKYCAANGILDQDQLGLMELVQQRRNAIHAFKDRPIGDAAELENSIRGYLSLMREIVRRLPYPEPMYVPQE
ncbi:hypothetical protein [Aureimonas pseudogalii]|uniref:Uncharacterized protein n=1 Tax=Aureimonas pseudogalii TaxID=1744844 RepID=A0A7W6EFB6_9HYPH|nr:hypothetical protein [Aureimonas pseudogalii]MBB3998367.1 hypothetical protein [Aureimonas pseudogalii]